MKRVKHVTDGSGGHYGYRFECPGCGEPHVIPIKPHPKGWDFSGDESAPTFSPSIHVQPSKRCLCRDAQGEMIVVDTPRCHSFVRAGRIEFLTDSTHALAGQTVDLPEIVLPDRIIS